MPAPVAELTFGQEILDVVGDRIRVLVDLKMSGGTCFVFECVTQPMGGPPLHRHQRDDEYFYIVEGTVQFMVDGREKVCTAGQTAVAKRGTIHAFCNIGADPSRMIITCTPGGLEDSFRATDELCRAGRATPETLAAAFAPYDLTFHGPPLAALQPAAEMTD